MTNVHAVVGGWHMAASPDEAVARTVVALHAWASTISCHALAQGCLLEQVAGDSPGALVEFAPASRIKDLYPEGGPRRLAAGGPHHISAGQPTDDSELALLVLDCVGRAASTAMYVQAGYRVGLVRGSRRIDEVGWERAARAAIAQVAAEPRVGDASLAISTYHEHLAERVGPVRLSVLHQRLRDEQQLKVSWASFYRYTRQHWPERLRPSPRITVRLDDPPPGEEAQIDYFNVGHWVDPETEHRHRLSAFLMTLSHSRHQFLASE